MRVLSFIFFAAIVGWAVALAVFVHSLPGAPVPADVKTDAIIVLTGGSDRVERGFDMLAQGAAPVLLISGVGENVTLQEMLNEHASAATRNAISKQGAQIVLDYVARSTESNAREAAQFVRERNYHSIRLITAHYHMPRSLTEMQAALPEVKIVSDPVFPAGFQREQWWNHENSRKLVISEFHKSIAVLLRPLSQRLQ